MRVPSALSTGPAPAQRPNLSAYLAEQILAMIRDRELKPGDRLPSARDLAVQFSVATPTIREALRRLQATGLIDIRHGSGIYVRREGDRFMLSNPAYGPLEAQTIMQVLDARLLIEPHLAGLAAVNAGVELEGLARLQSVLAAAEGALDRPDERYLRANFEIHSAIARLSGNLVLAHVVESLLEMHATELHVVDPDDAFAEIYSRDNAHHRLIVDAVAAGDAAGATQAMQRHLEAARHSIERRAAQSEEGR